MAWYDAVPLLIHMILQALLERAAWTKKQAQLPAGNVINLVSKAAKKYTCIVEA